MANVSVGDTCTKSDTFDPNAAACNVWLLPKAIARASKVVVDNSGGPLLSAPNCARISDKHMETDG